MLQDDQELCGHYASLVKHIEELYSLYKVLESAHEGCGGISFESEGVKFIFSAERHIERTEQTQCNDAHKLIEEYMILANISAVCSAGKAQEPALFRIYDKPDTGVITSFRTVLAESGLELPDGNRPEPRDYAEPLISIADRPDVGTLQMMLLRSTKQATCDSGNRGYFGLTLQSYTHFTLPTRCYSNLSLRRAIRYLLAREQEHKENSAKAGGWHYGMEEILQLGQRRSMTERYVDEAVREVFNWLKYDFMQDQTGNILSSIIANVTGFGFFIRLNDPFIDDLVHTSSLGNDYYRFDQAGQRLIGESGGQAYRLGDRVEACVEVISMDERRTNFSLTSNERASCDVGRIAREKTKKSTPSKSDGCRRQAGKQVNFKPDSVLRKKKDQAKTESKGEEKAKRPSARTQKIAAATETKRATKRKIAK